MRWERAHTCRARPADAPLNAPPPPRASRVQARAGGFSFADLVRANIDRLPGIFVSGEVPHEEDEMEDGEFSFLNLGLARQVRA